ncbi:maleylpyruvate isomerase family mycothiol-dependent enzyme [Streptomyces sp. SID12501]|uniref:Maleylpyruvate isomerase family mycothiol-dependent enzyme n=1 Tax=Streptomyces sp. SID12501 TaxID=2706042 RepID=A0A6B3C2I3_9ACTN|nr:maleylpyruvate isomerase family mycothiol-dependent enzyme [Streptomyces sp. SID12501]NEC90510.1 maleylpyruvate isomerase family mycothiol-dependent enzyme [Streptomyces sp. SID12501]
MPPAKNPNARTRTRTRTYDPVKTRTAVLTQYANIRTAVLPLTPDRLALPTRLGDWTVRDLVAHVTMAVETVSRNLDRDEPERAELALLDWPFATAARAADIAGDTRELADTHPDLDSLNALYALTEQRLTQRLATAPGTRRLATRTGAMTLADYLVTRTVELVVHTDDLNDAVPGLDIPYDRQALATCTRLLADALAAKAPGGSTEVRIPPYAVVQCVEGPRHTRGTPPNVVETDPLTWIRLATGRVQWADALDNAQVSASGERADLGGLLPLMA